jgi:hypothetical protein
MYVLNMRACSTIVHSRCLSTGDKEPTSKNYLALKYNRSFAVGLAALTHRLPYKHILLAPSV